MSPILEHLNKAGVRYLLIGGQAMRMKGLPRFSMDWDIWIPNEKDNIDRLNQALDDYLDCPVLPLGARGENFVQTYQTMFGVLQFHLALPGIASFAEAERRARTVVDDDGTSVRIVSDHDLLAAKKATGRPQDILDIEYLQQRIGDSTS